MDAVLGNYSLTLIDGLDSLVLFGRLEEFAVKNTSDLSARHSKHL